MQTGVSPGVGVWPHPCPRAGCSQAATKFSNQGTVAHTPRRPLRALRGDL